MNDVRVRGGDEVMARQTRAVRPGSDAVLADGPRPARAGVVQPVARHAAPGDPRGYRWVPYTAAGGIYLVLSVALWWHLWAHPTSVSTCGCGDNALTLWVLEWPAYALAHGQNLFFSSALFHPHGINMVPNSLALGTVFAPVTWTFGPVATSNVITTVSPVLSALAMFWLLRRWVHWTPAAFVGGLVYGFSPFALTSLALGHPNFGLLALPPLMVGCLEELVVTQAHRPWPVGLALGLATVAEFFVSVEVLLLLVLFSLAGLVAVALFAKFRRPGALTRRGPRAVFGLGVSAAVVVVLLAYPLWFYFKGPAHLSGRAWPNSPPGIVGSTVGDFFNGFISPALTGTMHLFGGYQGPALPLLTFLGVGWVVVALAGWAIWWRDPLLWLFGVLGLGAAVLSLGVHSDAWTPWRLFTHAPVIDNVVPVNLASITDLCAAVMVGVIMGHARRAALARSATWANVAGAALASLAIVPVTVGFWPNLPMTTRSVSSPVWFATQGRHAQPRQVVLPYPAALGGIQSSMAWQAVNGLSFDMVGGGGPGIVPSRQGPERPGFEVLARASLPLSPPPPPSAANLEAIRQALSGWGVTRVVVPDQPELPTYDRGRSVSYAVGLFTATLGRLPRFERRAWVWRGGAPAGAVAAVPEATFGRCVGTASADSRSAVARTARCVLRARRSS